MCALWKGLFEVSSLINTDLNHVSVEYSGQMVYPVSWTLGQSVMCAGQQWAGLGGSRGSGEHVRDAVRQTAHWGAIYLEVVAKTEFAAKLHYGHKKKLISMISKVLCWGTGCVMIPLTGWGKLGRNSFGKKWDRHINLNTHSLYKIVMMPSWM